MTNKTAGLVKAWSQAQWHVKCAKRNLEKAEQDLIEATTPLGQWLCPEDQQMGIPFNVWVGDGVLEVTRVCGSVSKDRKPLYTLKWRKEPSPQVKMEFGLS